MFTIWINPVPIVYYQSTINYNETIIITNTKYGLSTREALSYMPNRVFYQCWKLLLPGVLQLVWISPDRKEWGRYRN